jgi:hypothetical protein
VVIAVSENRYHSALADIGTMTSPIAAKRNERVDPSPNFLRFIVTKTHKTPLAAAKPTPGNSGKYIHFFGCSRTDSWEQHRPDKMQITNLQFVTQNSTFVPLLAS